jgi:hypothetical protein
VTSGCGLLSATSELSLNQKSSGGYGTVHAADLHYQQQVSRTKIELWKEPISQSQIQALVSSRCVEEARELGRLAYFWKMPVLNRAGTSVELFRRPLFPTVVHCTDTNVVGMGQALAKLMAHVNQTQVQNGSKDIFE